MRTDGAPGPVNKCSRRRPRSSSTPPSRRGARAHSNVDAFARRVEAALRGVSAAQRRCRARGARVAKGARNCARNPGDGRCASAPETGAPSVPSARRVTRGRHHGRLRAQSERNTKSRRNGALGVVCARGARAGGVWRRPRRRTRPRPLNGPGAAARASRGSRRDGRGLQAELLQARRAMTALVDALLKENEALAATRRVEY